VSEHSSSSHLAGRDRDIAAIRVFVDQAADHGGALVVSGDAGVGKTVLIEAAMSYAVTAGLRLLHVTGALPDGRSSRGQSRCLRLAPRRRR
jgi:predicted ATP-dependent serine protease